MPKENTHIQALYINGLHGRILKLPEPKNKKRQILLLYGHHASLERMAGIAANLNRYGAVTIPDLPGFGGMESFYKISRMPTLDNYADYLASIVKLTYKRRRVTIIAMSFSFLIVTRMLQKYPELVKKVELLVSSVGFVHKDDFHLPKSSQAGIRLVGRVCQHKPTAAIFRYVFLQKWAIRLTYHLVAKNHSKMKDAEREELKERINAEIKLWHVNDVRTRMKTMADMFSVDLCGKNIDLVVHHISVAGDRYFDNAVVEQHMRVIYRDYVGMEANVPAHMPSIVASAKEAAPFVPLELRRLLK